MKTFRDFEPGAVFETPRRTVTEAHRTIFAGLTGDAPSLTIGERSDGALLDDRVVHGSLVFSFSIGLMFEARVLEDVVIAYLGIDHLSHLAPCLVGDTIAVRATVTGCKPTSDGTRGVVGMRYDLTAVNRECDLMTAELLFLMHGEGSRARERVT